MRPGAPGSRKVSSLVTPGHGSKGARHARDAEVEGSRSEGQFQQNACSRSPRLQCLAAGRYQTADRSSLRQNSPQ